MSDVNKIWQYNKDKLPEDKLIAYMEGKLSPAEQHEVEKWLAAEGMEADAVDGLKTVPATEAKNIVHSLNQQLHSQLGKKKKRRTSPIKNNATAWIAVVIILLLCIVGYFVLRLAVSN